MGATQSRDHTSTQCTRSHAVCAVGQGENVHEYVRLSSLARMIGLRREGLKVLRDGFRDIIDADSLDFIQRQEFSWCDLQLMINY